MTQCARASFFISCFSRSQLHYHHYHHSMQKCIKIRFPCFRYFDACFWKPRFQCFLNDVVLLFFFLLIFSFSASLSPKYSSKFRLSSSPDDRISFECRSAAILAKKGCIEPVFGKTADRKIIMDYHPRD